MVDKNIKQNMKNIMFDMKVLCKTVSKLNHRKRLRKAKKTLLLQITPLVSPNFSFSRISPYIDSIIDNTN